MQRVQHVVDWLEEQAPRQLAADWDNVGLIVGDAGRPVSTVMTCLTLTPDVAAEAVSRGAELVVSHHPLLFRPVQRLTADNADGRMLLELIAAGVAVYSPHTSYDSAREGINEQLADALELRDVAPLRPNPAAERCIVVCFVPEGHLQAVQEGAWRAGAGQIGAYSECSFFTRGTGTFHGSQETHPAVGQAGRREAVDEVRLEVTCPAASVPEVVRGLRDAHPYEEPAVDVYPLKVLADSHGSGRFGTLPSPLSLEHFLARVKQRLAIETLQFVGEPSSEVRRVAVACGSAAEFLKDARREGCQLLLTGEARFHACLEARTLGIALVLPGHYATERPAMERLARRLAEQFPELDVWASESETDPLRWA